MTEHLIRNESESIMDYGLLAEQIAVLPIADAQESRRSLWLLFRQFPAWLYLMMCFISCFITSILQLTPGYLFGILTDHLRLGQGEEILFIISAVLLSLGIFRVISNFLATYMGYIASSALLATIRERFIQRVLTLNTSIIERSGTGDLMLRSGADNEKIADTVIMIFTELAESAITIAAVIVMMICIAPIMLICLVCGAISYIPAIKSCLKRADRIYRAENQAEAMLAQSLAVTMQGAKSIEIYALDQARRNETQVLLQNYSFAVRDSITLSARLITGVEFSLYLPIAGAILCGSCFYAAHIVSPGAILATGIFMIELVHPVETILYWIDQLQSSYAAYSRIQGVSDLVTQKQVLEIGRVNSNSIAECLLPQNGEIYAHNLSFHYPHSIRTVIDEINLHIPHASRIVIVGPSGAGKSTLARLLAGLDMPDKGTVTISGTEISHLPNPILRKYAVLVTQEHYIFIGTIADNLRIAQEDATDEQLLAAMHAIEADWIDELGLDTYVGSGEIELSAVQAQQIALARVLLADPAVVILDEATSLLDPRSARISERALLKIMHNRTVIAIAHRLYSAEIADQIIVLEQGKIIESGHHRELLEQSGIYAELWEAWMG